MIALAIVAVVVGPYLYLATRCTHVNAAMHPRHHGTLRCPDCGKAGVSFEDMGYEHGYISRANHLLKRAR